MPSFVLLPVIVSTLPVGFQYLNCRIVGSSLAPATSTLGVPPYSCEYCIHGLRGQTCPQKHNQYRLVHKILFYVLDIARLVVAEDEFQMQNLIFMNIFINSVVKLAYYAVIS